MYTLTINSQHNVNFDASKSVKKIWTWIEFSSGKRKLHHRAKVFEPAIEYVSGNKLYSRYGHSYHVNKTNDFLEVIVSNCIHSIGNEPSIIYKNGTKEWHFYGALNNLKGPAVVYANGDVEYWYHGLRHRLDGPAVIIGNKQYWFENGEFIKCIV